MPFLLVAGLGNPGFRYEKTRHNIGFRFVDAVQETVGFPPFTYEKKFLAYLSRLDMAGTRVLLLKPDTYMNLSGQAVRAVTDYFGISLDETVAIHDDLDIPFGTVKMKKGGGGAGHRGIESLIQHLNGDAFARIRLGIGRPPEGLNGKDYVLLPFTAAEEDIVTRLWRPVWPDLFRALSAQGFAMAANRFANRSCLPPPPAPEEKPPAGEDR